MVLIFPAPGNSPAIKYPKLLFPVASKYPLPIDSGPLIDTLLESLE